MKNTVNTICPFSHATCANNGSYDLPIESETQSTPLDVDTVIESALASVAHNFNCDAVIGTLIVRIEGDEVLVQVQYNHEYRNGFRIACRFSETVSINDSDFVNKLNTLVSRASNHTDAFACNWNNGKQVIVGKGKFMISKRPGTCALTGREFAAGSGIYYRFESKDAIVVL